MEWHLSVFKLCQDLVYFAEFKGSCSGAGLLTMKYRQRLQVARGRGSAWLRES